jgi:glycosyltransferase involved in cell wall biosynthesis
MANHDRIQIPPPESSRIGWPWEAGDQQSQEDFDPAQFPKVTIVTPSFNQGDYLEETIRSVLLQDYPNIEYYVMDGGSTDKSAMILQKYAPWLAGWTIEKDKGQADAINKGWQRSSGEFLGWLNSDDVLTPQAITRLVHSFQDHPDVDFIYGDLEYMDAESQFLRCVTAQDFDLNQIIREAGFITQPGSLVRRRLVNQIGYLDPALHFLMDLDFWLRGGLIGKFEYLREPVARFRFHSNSKSSKQTNLAANEIMLVYQKFFSNPNLPPSFLSIEKQAWGSAHLYAARSWYFMNQLGKAYQDVWKAFKIDPINLIKKPWLGFLGKLLALTLVGGRDSLFFQKFRRS